MDANQLSFLQTIKPFLINKGNKISKDALLNENNSLVNDQKQVCDVFNDFFVSVAKNTGSNSLPLMEIIPVYWKLKKITNVPQNFTLKMLIRFLFLLVNKLIY